MSEVAQILDEVRKIHTTFKEENDKAIEAAEKRFNEQRADDVEKLEKINADLSAKMEEYRKQLDELTTRMNRPSGIYQGGQYRGGDVDYEARCLDKSKQHGRDSLNDEERQVLDSLETRAFMRYLRNGYPDDKLEARALSNAGDGDGGFLIPQQFEAEVIKGAYDIAALRPYCQVGSTSRDVVVIPKLSLVQATWGGQKFNKQDINAGVERISVWPLRALVPVHNDTLADSAVNLQSEITQMFQQAVAEAEDYAFAVGAGDDSPQGMFTHKTIQTNSIKTGVAADISDAGNNGVYIMFEAMYKLKAKYRRDAVWIMNSNTEAKARSLKDSAGAYYFWEPPMAVGAAPTLKGKPIAVAEGSPDIGANKYPIAYGSPKWGYKIRDRQGVVVQRDESVYREQDMTGFFMKKRTGGQVVLAEAFVAIKCAV
jgi:HK97 family phage major capsid protein